MSKYFLTFFISISAFAQMANQETELPAIVRLEHLREEYQRVAAARSAQRPAQLIAANRRLTLLKQKAQAQLKTPACSHWSVPYAVARVKFLQGYDNTEVDESEILELNELKKQLDENGCCVYLPEYGWLLVRN